MKLTRQWASLCQEALHAVLSSTAVICERYFKAAGHTFQD